MPQRLPTPGSDVGTWGNVLNGFLQVAHNADGTGQDATSSVRGIVQLSGDLSGTATSPTVPGLTSKVSSVTAADGTVTIAGTATAPTVGVNAIPESKVTNLTTDLASTEKTTNKDQANGYAGLDSGGLLKTSELPGSVVTKTSPTIAATPDTAGVGQRLIVRSGAVRSVTEKLSAQDAGYLVAGSTADQSAGMQAFLNAVGAANGGKGGAGVLPPGIYHMGSALLKYPAAQTCDIEGALGWSGPNYLNGGTKLVWDADTTGAPHLNYALDMTPCATGTLRGVGMSGANQFTNGVGSMPCRMGGIRMGGRQRLERIALELFSSGIGLGGGTSGGFAVSASADHITLMAIYMSAVGWGINLLPGSTTQGDLHFYDMSISATLGGIAIAQSSGGLNGSLLAGVGLYAPVGFYRYGDGSGPTASFMSNNVMGTLSTEGSMYAAIYDELNGTGGGAGNITYNIMPNILYRSPNNGTYGTFWEKTFAVASSSATSLTVTDGSGFYFRPGMVVTGTGVPASTKIVSVAGTWPGATVTFTLNNAVAAPTSVLIAQPRLGAIVGGYVNNNEIAGGLGSTSGYPVFYGTQGIMHNTVMDGPKALTNAQAGQLVSGGTSFGNKWGNGDSIGIGTCQLYLAVSAGDILMTTAGQTQFAQKCNGTRKPIGVAIASSLGASGGSGGSIDYVTRIRAIVATVSVNNKSASPIPASALLYVDAANPGGVTATVPTTGWVAPIGLNGGTIITAMSAGAVDELWF